MIKVGVIGASGKMGRQVVEAISNDPKLQFSAAVDKSNIGSDSGEIAGLKSNSIKIEDSAKKAASTGSEVMVDFTHPLTVMKNINEVLTNGMHMVVGTTGITEDNLKEIEEISKNNSRNIFIAPNFAIGAVLMMEFSKKAAKYMDEVEIIELHHPQKADAPSGTALKTAKDMEGIINEKEAREEKLSLDGARGGSTGNINIHSIRLPGLVAHQEVIFGGLGQTLTIRHDSMDRTSFMPGIMLAIKEVVNRSGLTYGLENLLDM